jgi:hypothetical protein
MAAWVIACVIGAPVASPIGEAQALAAGTQQQVVATVAYPQMRALDVTIGAKKVEGKTESDGGVERAGDVPEWALASHVPSLVGLVDPAPHTLSSVALSEIWIPRTCDHSTHGARAPPVA